MNPPKEAASNAGKGMEALLRSPHIWRGSSGNKAQASLPTGFVELDRRLPGGGWPRGAVIEFFAEHQGVGELALWEPALANLSNEDAGFARVVFVVPPFIPYAPALVQRGIALERVLWIDKTAVTSGDALWAVEQIMRSGASALVLAWLQRVGNTSLRRLQLAAEEQGCTLVLFRPMAAMERSSVAALSMRASRHNRMFRVEILKCRGGRPAHVDLERGPQTQ